MPGRVGIIVSPSAGGKVEHRKNENEEFPHDNLRMTIIIGGTRLGLRKK
jgi:hypothetical protein